MKGPVSLPLDAVLFGFKYADIAFVTWALPRTPHSAPGQTPVCVLMRSFLR